MCKEMLILQMFQSFDNHHIAGLIFYVCFLQDSLYIDLKKPLQNPYLNKKLILPYGGLPSPPKRRRR